MLKTFNLSIVVILLFCTLCACDISSGPMPTPPKYLAKNIIFDNDIGDQVFAKLRNKKSYTDSSSETRTASGIGEIDTETQIRAENVIFEGTTNSQIESDNVQDALEEITLKLSDIIVGRWRIQNYNQENEHAPTGLIEIYDDGTFNLISGSFAAVGMGSSGFCSHLEENQTYEIYTEELMRFSHYNNTTLNSVIPNLIKLRENEITFLGAGGCGIGGRTRVSILSRDSQ